MSESFADLLRGYRLRCALTQERLAEKAAISPAAVAALESGRRRSPRLSTVALLAEALSLNDLERSSLVAAAAARTADQVARQREPNPHRGGPAGAAGTTGSSSLPSTDTLLAPVGGWRRRFIGRSPELARLAAAWSRPRRLVLVTGEAGIGKSRLVDFHARTRVSDGAEVLCGRWTEERLGPFEGFVQPLRQAFRRSSASALVGCQELPRIIPEAATLLPDSGTPTRADADTERRLLFEAVSNLFASLGAILLILDDLQWADQDSMALLKYLASSPSLLDLRMVATVRSTDMAPAAEGAIADLSRRSDVEFMELGALDVDELAELVTLVGEGHISRTWATEVAHASEGNTFFAEELAELRLSQEALSSKAVDITGLGVPDRIRATVNGRLSSLSTDAQMMLRAGSILWRQFDPRLAARVAELPTESLVPAIEDALLSGLVVEGEGSQLAFSHGLVQATVHDSLSVHRRMEFHRRAAVELESTGDVHDPAAVTRIARHWGEVAMFDPSAVPAAARWTVRAGDAAFGAAATDQAIAHYEQARDWWAVTTTEHIETLIKLGAALYACGRSTEADEQYRLALSLARGLGDLALEARAALGLSQTLVLGRVDPERVAALEDVLEKLQPSDDAPFVLVLATLLRQLIFDRTPETTARREVIAKEVLAAVDRPDLSEEVLIGLGSMREFIPITEPEPLDRLTRQIIGVAGRRRELQVLANGWWGQAWSSLERADPTDWSRAVAAYNDAAEKLGSPAALSAAASLQSTAAQLEGRFEESMVLSELALELGHSANDPNAEALHLGRSVLIGWDTGRAAELLPAMAELAHDFENVATFQSGLTLTAALAGDLATTRRMLSGHGRHGFRDVRIDVEWIGTLVFFANASVIAGELDCCELLYGLLVKSPLTGVRLGPLTGWWGAVDHHLGALCRMLGRLEEAKVRLERALEIERRMGAAPFCARTRDELEILTTHG